MGVDNNKGRKELNHPRFPVKSSLEADRNMSKLPGDPELYIDHPPKVDYYDVFYFESRTRDMLNEFIEPWREAALEDKEKAAQLRLDYNTILERVHELESYALI